MARRILLLLCLCSLAWGAQASVKDHRSFLRGGDLTYVTYIEDWGTVFRYQDGTPGDVFDILEEYGVNFARLRLYNQPGIAHSDGNYQYRLPFRTTAHPAGYEYAGLSDILSLAQRAKAHHMQICLTLHYSDFWTNAGEQRIPTDWASAHNTQALADSVTAYTTHVIQRMVDQGTAPEFVAIGNETNWGLLFGIDESPVAFGGYGSSMTQWITLFNAAYDAVKAVSPSTQVVFHHSMGHDGGISTCQNLFDQLITQRKMRVDVIGGSYYPYWASLQSSDDNTPTGMLAWANAMETRYGLPILIMETGYSWAEYNNPARNGGNYSGQLHTNGSYGTSLATEQGQADFIAELHQALDTDTCILGYLYWDPIFVDQQVNGSWIQTCWAEKKSGNTWYYDGNAVANTTWFDYTGLPLKALYEEVASRKEVPFSPAPSDWFLYLWSYTNNAYLDMPQFQTTEDDNIFSLSGYSLTETGAQFCVTNAAWSAIYGWESDGDAIVSIAADVHLGSATSANGWISLPAGTYNITFNSAASTIRFDYLYTESRTSQANKWGTVCLPFSVTSIENAVAYNVDGMVGTTGIALTAATLPLTAGQPYLYKASDTNVVFCSASATTATEAVSATGLVGNISGEVMAVANNGTSYVLSNNQLLKVVSDGVQIADRRAYIDINGLSQASAPEREIMPLPAVPTEIVNIEQRLTSKMLINGQLMIIRDGVLYNVTGMHIQWRLYRS